MRKNKGTAILFTPLRTQKLFNERKYTPGVPRNNHWHCEQWPVNSKKSQVYLT